MNLASTLGLLSALAAGLLFGYGAVVQARSARSGPDVSAGLRRFVVAGINNPRVVFVVVLYLVGFAFHALAIQLLPLYLAQAGIALSLPVTALFARQVSEHVGLDAWSSVGAVCVGLALLAIAAGPPSVLQTDWQHVVVVWLGFVVLAVSTRTSTHPVWLGLLGGIGYAGSAIAVRVAGHADDRWAMGVAALAVPAFGVVAFWTYSRALKDERVTTATAPLVAAETFVPSLVGVVWLGDQIRNGWWSAVVAGLLLCVMGSLALAHRSSDTPPGLTAAHTS